MDCIDFLHESDYSELNENCCRFRHLMLDLTQLIVNAKKDAKLDTKSQRQIINEVADIKVVPTVLRSFYLCITSAQTDEPLDWLVIHSLLVLSSVCCILVILQPIGGTFCSLLT